ncbi:uncharacterized protein BJ212DRAFT_1306026 [Suillus subaureus]|uniref:Uncharacterized protein n=1 Tax=Suillus subaureus TaxID=48587 RepID=A0A9P7DKR7_9AGAM|nr:uncharacterized protein BJ212DRAFT_1306026 [Suillus subaureus]KAG1797261.1 hypothetical protein BJ212DRAFT_1306026 [Suillus subaureus]
MLILATPPYTMQYFYINLINWTCLMPSACNVPMYYWPLRYWQGSDLLPIRRISNKVLSLICLLMMTSITGRMVLLENKPIWQGVVLPWLVQKAMLHHMKITMSWDLAWQVVMTAGADYDFKPKYE